MSAHLATFVWADMDEAARQTTLTRPAARATPDITAQVDALINRVRRDGDTALRELTRELDGVALETLRVSADEAETAQTELPENTRAAMQIAIDNVSRFHSAQAAAPVTIETTPGVVCQRLLRPVSAVGLYVPAGSAPLPSTAIMLAVPARLAECPTRVLCTPPRRDGRADPAVVTVAWACGVRDIFKVGGAQAIAAMAYGTETIPKVDKVFGPGNAWVTAAKKAVATDPDGAALDLPAGPSEVMVIADTSADPCFVALDLLSQAEHGPDSQVTLVTTDPSLPAAVNREIDAALPSLPRRSIIEESLTHGAGIVVPDVPAALAIANQYAPEHLIMQVENPEQWIDHIEHAGSVFLGPWTPESVGDYCSGTNHVLPTYGYARTYSGLSVRDFQKHLTVQQLTAHGLESLAPTVRTLAAHEGLDAHAQAVDVRLAAQRNRTVA